MVFLFCMKKRDLMVFLDRDLRHDGNALLGAGIHHFELES